MMKLTAAEYLAERSAATAAATARLLNREDFRGNLVFEPFRTDQGIVQAVHKSGLAVFTASNRLLENDKLDITHIISEPIVANVPISVKPALSIVMQKVAFLLPLSFITRAKVLIDETPLARIYLLEKRLAHRKGPMAWFVWQRGWVEPPALRWLEEN